MSPYQAMMLMLNPTGYLFEQLKKNSESFDMKTESSDREALELESLRQEIRSKATQDIAKAEQEIAIARRIQIAYEVEIEEFYDVETNGKAGLGANSDSVSLGVSGSGRKIVKRVIRFKGFAGNDMEIQKNSPEDNV